MVLAYSAAVIGGRLYGLSYSFIFANVLIGVSEEVLFRGFLYNGLRQYISRYKAIWISTLSFGLAHVDGIYVNSVTQIVWFIVGGLIFGLVYARYGSILLTSAVHTLLNIIIFGLQAAVNPPYFALGLTTLLVFGASWSEEKILRRLKQNKTASLWT